MAKEWTPFRRKVRARMIELGMKSKELAEKINEATGRSFDEQYIAKVCDGERWSPCVMEHLCRFLDIPFPDGYWNKKEEWHGETGPEDKA